MYSFDENECQYFKYEWRFFMKKYLSAIVALTLCLCLFMTGCSKGATNSELSSISPNSTPTELVTTEIPSENIMANYYGMTMQDIIDIWGTDYVLNDYLLDAAFAGIYYNDGRCPFTFFYRSNTDFAPKTCETTAKVTGIKVNNFNHNDYYVTKDIPVTISYDVLSTKLEGEYTPDDMWGGNTFECTSIENVDVVWFTWHEDKNVPSRLLLHFDNASDKDWSKNNSSNETEPTISNNTSSQNTSNKSQTTITKPVENTKKETEIFSDIFRTDYFYAQDNYCSDGRYIYTSFKNCTLHIYDTQSRTCQAIDLKLDKQNYALCDIKNFTIYNGYVTASIVNLNVGCTDGILIYNVSTKDFTIIHNAVPIEAAFVYGDYIYIKYGSGYTIDGLIQRSPLNTTDRKWETVIDSTHQEYTICQNYIFGNRGDSKQMYRLDISTGNVKFYTNGLSIEKTGFLQSDNWLNTNQGVFDVNSDSIKYGNENYYIYGDTGVNFNFEMRNTKYTLIVDFLNFKTGQRTTRTFQNDNIIRFSMNSDYIAKKGCTYNGIYDSNWFFTFENQNGNIGFKKHIGPVDFSDIYDTTRKFGCLFVLNDYYYYVNQPYTQKAPLSDMSNKTNLLNK